jgi:glycosyltransferase involved in cell wall biosynthesis
LDSKSYNILAINWQDIRNPYAGGAEVHFHEIFKRVAAAGHRVTLLCCGYPGAPPEEEIDGIHIMRCGSRNFFNWSVPFAYRRLAAENRFDVVIDDLNKIPFFTPWYVREPLLGLIHHFFGKSIYLETNWLAASYVYSAERLAACCYRRTPFAAVSTSTADELRRCGHQSWIEILSNAVDLSAYREQSSAKSREPLLGYLGRLKKYKSVDHVIQALPAVLQRHAAARLLIIGDGDDRPRLETLVRQLGLASHVTFTGHVSHEQKVAYLNQLWIAVNPSPKEGWGLTVIEANACGVPVLAADSPGLRDSVQDGITGLLYPYGDLHRMAEAISDFLADVPGQQRYRMGALAWAGTFTWDASAQKAIEIINRVIHQ